MKNFSENNASQKSLPVMRSTVQGKPASNSLIESAYFCADLLWCNVKPRWRVITTLLWILFPLFAIAALILEVATAPREIETKDL